MSDDEENEINSGESDNEINLSDNNSENESQNNINNNIENNQIENSIKPKKKSKNVAKLDEYEIDSSDEEVIEIICLNNYPLPIMKWSIGFKLHLDPCHRLHNGCLRCCSKPEKVCLKMVALKQSHLL